MEAFRRQLAGAIPFEKWKTERKTDERKRSRSRSQVASSDHRHIQIRG